MRRSPVNRHIDGQRSSIGDAIVDQAIGKLNQTMSREIAVFQTKRWSAGELIPLMFTEDTIKRAQAAKGIIAPRSDEIMFCVMTNVQLTLTFPASTPAINPTFCALQPGFQEVLDVIEAIREIHAKYGRVKAVLRWFNRHATAAAIRNYWPSVIALCGKSSAFDGMHEFAPERYATPTDIGTMLPLIRETAGTVATMALMGETPLRVKGSVQLRLDACKVEWQGLTFSLDTQHVYL